jgi:hypothetical protein
MNCGHLTIRGHASVTILILTLIALTIALSNRNGGTQR